VTRGYSQKTANDKESDGKDVSNTTEQSQETGSSINSVCFYINFFYSARTL